MKKLFTLIVFSMISLASSAQNYPVYNQYFNNPYLINPAFVGNSGYTELGLTHRRQWVGIEGAPVLTSLNVQYPTKTPVALGLTFTSSSAAYEKRSSVQATFAYKVTLGEEHFLKFGLAGGVGNYFLDGSQIETENLSDPAVQRMLGSHYFYDGQFGIHYHIKGLNLGFAVPRLFDSRTLTNSKFKDVSHAELKFNLFSASYRFGIGQTGIAIEPYLIHRMGNDVKEKWEGLTTLYIKNLVWLGASYRQQYGSTAFGGIQIKNMKFGYAYELPNSSIAALSKGSHELQLNIKFGERRISKNDRKRTPLPIVQNTAKTTKKVEKEEITESQKPATVAAEVPKVNSPAQPEEIKKEAPGAEVTIQEKKSTHPLELKKANYLVVGVFKMVKNAEGYKKQLKALGYTTFIGFSSKSGSFYVYLSQYEDIQEARDERSGVRELELFKNAWIMTVE